MAKKKLSMRQYYLILGIICIIILALRLFFAFSTDYFSDDAYFNLRQIENIRDTGTPLYNDELSFQERTYFFTPGFHYIIAFFSLMMPVSIAAKLIPNIFATLLTLVVFLIALEMTKNRNVSLIAAFVSGFIPVFFSKTINNISAYTLAIPLMFLSLYFIILINKNKKYATHTIITIITLMIVHPSIFYLIIGLLFYLVFVKQDKVAQAEREFEVIIFSIFLTIWFYALVYKKALLFHGVKIITQNIPQALLADYFSQITILKSIVLIGIVPFTWGLYVMYKYTFKEKKKSLYLFIGLAMATFVMLWFRWIEINLGMIILGVALIILFSQYVKDYLLFMHKTKFSRWKWISIAVLLIFVVFTSAFPSIGFAMVENEKIITQEDVEALHFLRDLSEEPSVTAASISESHLISYFANDMNIIDNNFLLVKDVNTLYSDITDIYSEPLLIPRPIEVIEKYGIQYIYMSQEMQEKYGPGLRYADDNACVKLLYDGKSKIYDVKECKRITVIS